MRKISMVMLTGLLGCSALAAAAVPPTAVQESPVPQTAQSAPASASLPWLPADANSATADPLGSLFPSQQVCLCILGDHCCVIHGKQTCVPNSQPCP